MIKPKNNLRWIKKLLAIRMHGEFIDSYAFRNTAVTPTANIINIFSIGVKYQSSGDLRLFSYLVMPLFGVDAYQKKI